MLEKKSAVLTPFRSPLIMLLALAVSACAGMSPGFETPTVNVSSFRTLPSESGMPKFEIGLHVTNPNSEALKLRGVAYTISVEGRELMKGVGNELPVIEGYGEGDFTVTAAASLFEGAMLLKDLVSGPVDVLNYEFEAKLDVGTFIPAIRVKDTGEFSLQPSR
jgi:LEA14-like dessication related protein